MRTGRLCDCAVVRQNPVDWHQRIRENFIVGIFVALLPMTLGPSIRAGAAEMSVLFRVTTPTPAAELAVDSHAHSGVVGPMLD